MSEVITGKEALAFLLERDHFTVLAHQSPDCDTLGSAFGLAAMLRHLGKKANVACSDPFPERYGFLYAGYQDQEFQGETVVSVDIADETLFGEKLARYRGRVDLAVDHHLSHVPFAARRYVRPEAAATCQILEELFHEGDIPLTRQAAGCLYTGLLTDTGCFQYDCTSPETHRCAARLMERGIPAGKINRALFGLKTRTRIALEQYVYQHTEFFLEGACAAVILSRERMEASGLDETEFDGIAALTVQTEGVEIGITIKEKEDGTCKVSLRSSGDANVSRMGERFGGGGHIKAAGCRLQGTPKEALSLLLEEARRELEILPAGEELTLSDE